LSKVSVTSISETLAFETDVKTVRNIVNAA